MRFANLLAATAAGPQGAEFFNQGIRRDIKPSADQKRWDLNLIKLKVR